MVLVPVLGVLEAANPDLSWVPEFTAAIVAVFVLYVGVALAAALFHRDDKARRHAGWVLQQLLHLFGRGRR